MQRDTGWVKQGIDVWVEAAQVTGGRLLRAIHKGGKAHGNGLSDWAIWSVVEAAAAELGIDHLGAHDLRRTCAKLCRSRGGDIEQIKFLLGHSSIQTTERISVAVRISSERSMMISAWSKTVLGKSCCWIHLPTSGRADPELV